jgi:hypothetical protein
VSPDEILFELSNSDGVLPRAALQAAAEHKDALTEPLLDALRRFVECTRNPEPGQYESEPLADMAMYLLAQFREVRAFALYEELCRLPEDRSEFWLSDMLNEDFGSFLASTCGDEAGRLQRLAEEPGLYMYARWAALTALTTLVIHGAWTREAMIAWLGEIWPRWMALADDGEYTPLIATVCDLGASELLPQVRRAFAAGEVDPLYITLEEVEDACALGDPITYGELRRRHQYVDDAAKRMSWQAQFRPDYRGDDGFDDEYPADEEFDDFVPMPYIRPEPKVGRNDPCPCGSGKKFKKCCLRGDGNGQDELAVLR